MRTGIELIHCHFPEFRLLGSFSYIEKCTYRITLSLFKDQQEMDNNVSERAIGCVIFRGAERDSTAFCLHESLVDLINPLFTSLWSMSIGAFSTRWCSLSDCHSEHLT